MSQPDAAIRNTATSPLQADLRLTTTFRGLPILVRPLCRFSYQLNFRTRKGAARLYTVEGSPVSIPLYPFGGEGVWDFVSAIQPTRFRVGNQWVVLYRAAFNIDLFTGEASAALLLDPYGSSAVITPNFDPFCAALNRHYAPVHQTARYPPGHACSKNNLPRPIIPYKPTLYCSKPTPAP